MTDRPVPTAEIDVALAPRPSELRMRERRDFRLDIVVTNRGDLPIDAPLDRARLSVDGEYSVYFSFTVTNGIREPGEFRVAPGESLTTSWPRMGPHLFDRPGDHTLVLTLDDATSAPTTVRVRR